jgi:hypothetical protein
MCAILLSVKFNDCDVLTRIFEGICPRTSANTGRFSRYQYEVSSVGHISAKRGAEIYLWKKENWAASKLALLQSAAA